jgi:hypothetical protein
MVWEVHQKDTESVVRAVASWVQIQCVAIVHHISYKSLFLD